MISPAFAGSLPNLHFLSLFNNIIQRPLKTIARISGDVYIPRGVSVPALDKDTLWEFQPKKIGNLFHSILALQSIVAINALIADVC